MSQLTIDSQQILADSKKLLAWGVQLNTMWVALSSSLSGHTVQTYFGDAVPGIARFYQDYTNALADLGNYLIGSGKSATSAFAYFSEKLTLAATTYDEAAAQVNQKIAALPQS